jgi:RNA polymerase sigma factor (TIGR02999 family)
VKANTSGELTDLLLAWGNKDKQALEKLTPLIYKELRRLARHYMRAERRDHTLQATALVNEAFIKLVDVNRVRWKNRAHFFGVSAQLMRGILVDSARKRRSLKRGNGAAKLTLLDEALEIIPSNQSTDLVALDDALKALESVDDRKVRVVELRFFGGLSIDETAEVLHVSSDTVMRDWKLAKAWLYREIRRGIGGEA